MHNQRESSDPGGVLRGNGISALRVWCQWNFPPPHDVRLDSGPERTEYDAGGEVRLEPFARLDALPRAAPPWKAARGG